MADHLVVSFDKSVKEDRDLILQEIYSMKSSLQEVENGEYYFIFNNKVVGYEWDRISNCVRVTDYIPFV